MKKSQFVILAIAGCLILAAAALAQAEVWIKNLSVERQGEFVAVRIYGSQPFQFTHATEEAKNGKPFRIYVDCQDASFALPQNNYFNLPGQTVAGLRSSQYQESPNKIVRVVLDCTRAVTYKVQSSGNSAEISIASPQEPNFVRWEAVKSDNSHLASANPAAAQPQPKSPAVTAPQTDEKPATLPETKVQAQTQHNQKPTVSPQVVTTQGSKPDVQQPAGPKVNVAKPTLPQVTATAKTPVQTAQENQPAPTVKSEDKIAKPVTPPTKTAAAPPVLGQNQATGAPEQKPLVLANKAAVEQWAGLPQRETVKYSSRGKRDPFSPLFERIEESEFGVAPIPSIENLELVGVLESPLHNWALCQDARGFGYILQAGDRIKEGRVLRVDQDRVVFQVSEYGWTRNVTLELYNLTK
jgi:hypothetical protein